MERGSRVFGGGREEDVVNNGLGEVFEEGVEDVPRVCVLFLQVGAASDHVCNHLPLHQGDKVLEIQNQERPRISERKVRQGKVVLGVKSGHLRRGGVHQIHSLNQVSESVIDVSRERFVVVRLRVVHIIILIRDMNRIESCCSLPPNVCAGVLKVSFKRGVRE